MPRRRHRSAKDHERAKALDEFLGEDYRFTRDPEEAARRRAARRKAREEAAARAFETNKDSWTKCVVPDCKFQTFREHDGIPFPICGLHAEVAWEYVEKMDQAGDTRIHEAREALRARRKAIADEKAAEWRATEAEADAEWKAKLKAGTAPGDIYYVRANGLIKVGWSSDLWSRLRAYGANAELLVHYPGTKNDERELHQRLTPSRAKGREWYHDDDIVKAFVNVALRQYGPPKVHVLWTEHRPQVGGKRYGGRVG